MQVNSLGLTEQQPENNVYRILLETLAVVLSKSARARAVQLPAWNEALGLPREWDQQWSLRLQQILAYETDLLEYGDLFDGSPVIAAKVAELMGAAEAELARIDAMGGALAAVDPATSSSAWSSRTARGSRRSPRARRRWSASTASPRARPRRSPPARAGVQGLDPGPRRARSSA